MERNGNSTKFESNHLHYGSNIMALKEYNSMSNNRNVASGRNVSSVPLSAQNSIGQVMTSANGQHLAQTVSISIDGVADRVVVKPKIASQGMDDDNEVMNEIGQEHEINVHIGERDPSPLAKHDFLVSFLVDARGGSMYGCRNSGIKVN